MLSAELLLASTCLGLSVLAASLYGLAALGHFPLSTRQEATRGKTGSAVLWGSMATVTISVATAAIVAWWLIPWYSEIIAAGLAILLAPLLLQYFSDDFVDGRNALLCFSGLSLVFAAALVWALTAAR